MAVFCQIYWLLLLFISPKSFLVCGSTLESVVLQVESSNTLLNGKYLTGIREDKEISALFITPIPQEYNYIRGNSPISCMLNNRKFNLGYIFDELVLSSRFTAAIQVQKQYLSVNGSTDAFYACSSLPYDPAGKTAEYMGIQISHSMKSDAGCQPVKIKMESVHTQPPHTTLNFHASAESSQQQIYTAESISQTVYYTPEPDASSVQASSTNMLSHSSGSSTRRLPSGPVLSLLLTLIAAFTMFSVT